MMTRGNIVDGCSLAHFHQDNKFKKTFFEHSTQAETELISSIPDLNNWQSKLTLSAVDEALDLSNSPRTTAESISYQSSQILPVISYSPDIFKTDHRSSQLNVPSHRQIQDDLLKTTSIYGDCYGPFIIKSTIASNSMAPQKNEKDNGLLYRTLIQSKSPVPLQSVLFSMPFQESLLQNTSQPISFMPQHSKNPLPPSCELTSCVIDADTSTLISSEHSTSITKSTRPFKTFPRDPLVIAAKFSATDFLYSSSRTEGYTEYRNRVLKKIQKCHMPKLRRASEHCFTAVKTNLRLKRSNSNKNDTCLRNEEDSEIKIAQSNSPPNDFTKVEESNKKVFLNGDSEASSTNLIKDAAYYERRRKNNAAAKKSRDRRRIKEDEIAIRAAYLEQQNMELICQINFLKSQLAALNQNILV